MSKTVNMLGRPSMLAAIGHRANAQSGLADDVGALLRTLAASKLGGVVLQIGSGTPEVGAWLLDGMDITSRFITLVGDRRNLADVNTHLGNDIRVAVHVQDALGFLTDISAHRLQMIVFDSPPESDEILAAALHLLEPGALMVCLRSGDRTAMEKYLEYFGATENLRAVDVFDEGRMILVARRPDTVRTVRRGARRLRRQAAER